MLVVNLSIRSAMVSKDFVLYFGENCRISAGHRFHFLLIIRVLKEYSYFWALALFYRNKNIHRKSSSTVNVLWQIGWHEHTNTVKRTKNAEPMHCISRLWNNLKQSDIWSQFLELLLPWGKPKSTVIYVIIKCTEEKATYNMFLRIYGKCLEKQK